MFPVAVSAFRFVMGYIVIAALTAFSCTLFAFREIHVSFCVRLQTSSAVHRLRRSFLCGYQVPVKTRLDVHPPYREGNLPRLSDDEAGYAAVMLAPFPLLRQMVLFNLGLLSSFISIMVLFPNFNFRRRKEMCSAAASSVRSLRRRVFAWKHPARIIAVAIAAAFVICRLARLEMKNDIRTCIRCRNTEAFRGARREVLNSAHPGNFHHRR